MNFDFRQMKPVIQQEMDEILDALIMAEQAEKLQQLTV